MILVIDNYDSFVYNLARYFECAGQETKIMRNDDITIQEIIDLAPDGIVLSPGPCSPNEAGICIDLVQNLGAHIPILGVCLGHQVIGQAYGGNTVRAPKPVHGKSSQITHSGTGLFHDLPSLMNVGRYHSLVTQIQPSHDLIVDAIGDHKIVMAMHHKTHPVYGIQFHPESILTEYGIEIIENFISITQQFKSDNKQAA